MQERPRSHEFDDLCPKCRGDIQGLLKRDDYEHLVAFEERSSQEISRAVASGALDGMVAKRYSEKSERYLLHLKGHYMATLMVIRDGKAQGCGQAGHNPKCKCHHLRKFEQSQSSE